MLIMNQQLWEILSMLSKIYGLSSKKEWEIRSKLYLCSYGNKDIGTISTYSTTE